MCQKSSGACRNAKSLFERSEFDLADTETTNFWQRSRHSLDFSLMLDFAHVQQIENKFSFVFTQSQNWFVSFGQAKEMKGEEHCSNEEQGVFFLAPCCFFTPKSSPGAYLFR